MALDTGTDFIPCEENPYYRLATVHGVPDEKMSRESCEELIHRNRVTWNRYFAQGLDDSEKDKLKTQGVPSDEIDLPLTAAEQQAIRQRLDDLEEPNYKQTIDFSKVQFDLRLDMEGFVFPNIAYFSGAKFPNIANFAGAKFSNDADFVGAKFSGDALFTGAPKEQERREFGGLFNFTGATFEEEVDFTNRVFFNKTTFDQCEFLTTVPNFAEAKLHQLTTWRDVTWPSLPMIDKTEVKDDPNLDEASKIEEPKETSRKRIYRVEDQVDAYRNLRLRMKQIENYQQEVFFLGKELDAKRRVHWLNKAYFRWFPSLVYKLFSDYGTSVARPVKGLVWVIVGFGLLVFWNIAGGEWGSLGGMDLWILLFQSLCFSGTHALPFISPVSASHSMILHSLPLWMVVPAGIAKTLGIGSLFLIGLALRNRFRIR